MALSPESFDEHGLLLDGVHSCSLAEIEQAFGLFRRSDRRCRLFARLRAYVDELRKCGWDVYLIVDGSFVMKCVDEPEDIDMLLVLPTDWDLLQELPPSRYNLVSRRSIRRNYRFDAYVVVRGSKEERDMMTFFAGVNPKWRDRNPALSRSKGLVRIQLHDSH